MDREHVQRQPSRNRSLSDNFTKMKKEDGDQHGYSIFFGFSDRQRQNDRLEQKSIKDIFFKEEIQSQLFLAESRTMENTADQARQKVLLDNSRSDYDADENFRDDELC